MSGEGTQYQYYKNATANRYKMPKWGTSSSYYVSNIYHERSPLNVGTEGFCGVSGEGGVHMSYASAAFGIATNFCI